MEIRTCPKCKEPRRLKQFSLIDYETGERRENCRFCNYSGFTAAERHKILREAYRHYPEFKQYVADTGRDVITYAVPKEEGSSEYVPVTISFTDLTEALKKRNDGLRAEGTVLSARKEQAFIFNVIQDMLQRDVAEIMGITTVSVGQYVDQAMLQLCEYYFAEDIQEDTEDTSKVAGAVE